MIVSVRMIPNLLTILRIIFIPVLFAVFYADWKFSGIFSAAIFAFASLTDFFDGYLARLLKAQSRFGKVLDPIADKMIVATAILVLVHAKHITNLTLIPAVIILCREIFVSGLREYKGKVEIPVNNIGKLKTAFQMIAILFFLLDSNGYILKIAEILFWLSALLSVWSGYKYFIKFKFRTSADIF